MADPSIHAASFNWTHFTIYSCGRSGDHITRLSSLDLLPRCSTISVYKNPHDEFTSNHNQHPEIAYYAAHAIAIIHNEVSPICFGAKRKIHWFVLKADKSHIAEMQLYERCYEGFYVMTVTTRKSS